MEHTVVLSSNVRGIGVRILGKKNTLSVERKGVYVDITVFSNV
jgi:hypothetical protein